MVARLGPGRRPQIIQSFGAQVPGTGRAHFLHETLLFSEENRHEFRERSIVRGNFCDGRTSRKSVSSFGVFELSAEQKTHSQRPLVRGRQRPEDGRTEKALIVNCFCTVFFSVNTFIITFIL